MIKCTLEREKLEGFNKLICEKNNLSPLNKYETKDFSEDDLTILNRMGMISLEGNLFNSIKPTINLLSNPQTVVNLTFTGGAGSYEHYISYDNELSNYVTFTITPDSFTIDDETNAKNIINVLKDFVGISNLKTLNISQQFSSTEALVIAALIDMDRKSKLRAFVDELPYNRNSYNASMIWRIINSTCTSIQWFVSVINEIIGEHPSLTVQQVQSALELLTEKGAVIQKGVQYQLSDTLDHLSDRMVIVDNTLSVQITRSDEIYGIVSSGFTCLQSGVHDLLLLDYNGKDLVFETISSVKLIDYLEQFMNCHTYISKLRA